MIAVVCTAFVCSCGSTITGPPRTASEALKQHGTPLASATDGERSTPTAWDIVRELTRAGLGATNPLDTTAFECRSAGCQESVVTDQLRIKSFSSAQLASRYASTRGLPSIGTVVVSFAPPLPASERETYWAKS